MKKLILIALLLPGYVHLVGQTPSRPESIIYDSAHERYLISNFSDGATGSIIAYDPFEDVYSYFNQEHTQGPKGLAIYQNTLYVSDRGFVNGFNLETGQRVFNKQIGSAWINDLAVDAQGILYLGERNLEIIYKINPLTGQVEEWITGDLEEVNGLWVDEAQNRLVVCFSRANSPIKAFDLETAEATTLAETNFSVCDGIAVDNCGTYYFSTHGSSAIFCFDQNFSDPPSIFLEDLVTPADIYFNPELEVLCIPEIDNNRILFIDIFQTCQKPLLTLPEDAQSEIYYENISFSWEPIPRAGYYRFELAEDPGFERLLIAEGVGTPEFMLESLDNNTTYYWRVSAYSENQHTEYSDIRSFETSGSSLVGNVESQEQYKLFPNPAGESVTLHWIHGAPKSLKLFNSTGQLAYEFKASSPQVCLKHVIPLQGLSSGSYYCVVIQSDTKTWGTQLIVQK
ncbi:MAG: T9SS type A sorting domain-containing protein [Bacteroidetes bacterium]|jgi:hypothetical protein|nr:T9SS type A sorting domain-containing protein [Bacteroidota bacterium]MBT4401130.1 T9SS type A sorting domain-containing protein [Bacteroidota bacterium]MBT4408622.1 T9SS type A sorting domain-containing protein [Bacteroidota bacterium]MBT7466110.1 T9SS type A sorting domain-containing protein [Bacteroidota bacterium]